MVDRVVKRGKTRVGVEREVDVSGAGQAGQRRKNRHVDLHCEWKGF